MTKKNEKQGLLGKVKNALISEEEGRELDKSKAELRKEWNSLLEEVGVKQSKTITKNNTPSVILSARDQNRNETESFTSLLFIGLLVGSIALFTNNHLFLGIVLLLIVSLVSSIVLAAFSNYSFKEYKNNLNSDKSDYDISKAIMKENKGLIIYLIICKLLGLIGCFIALFSYGFTTWGIIFTLLMPLVFIDIMFICIKFAYKNYKYTRNLEKDKYEVRKLIIKDNKVYIICSACFWSLELLVYAILSFVNSSLLLGAFLILLIPLIMCGIMALCIYYSYDNFKERVLKIINKDDFALICGGFFFLIFGMLITVLCISQSKN